MRTIATSYVAVVVLIAGLPMPAAARAGDPLTPQNVVWDAPSKDSSGSMPIGNGDVGLNVWAEPNGDVVFLIAKTDSWSENARLLKLGRVRVRFSPNPLAAAGPFRQELRLRQGEIAIQLGEGPKAITATLWVDANRPVVHLDAESPSAFEMEAKLEVWRTALRRSRKTGGRQRVRLARRAQPDRGVGGHDCRRPQGPGGLVPSQRPVDLGGQLEAPGAGELPGQGRRSAPGKNVRRVPPG